MQVQDAHIIQITMGSLKPRYLFKYSENATTTTNSVFEAELFTAEEAREIAGRMRAVNALTGENESVQVWTAAAVIHNEAYPLEA